MIETHAKAAIRRMVLDDLPAVLGIDQVSFPNPWPERSFRFELMENPASHLLVAEVKTSRRPRLVGFVGYWLIVEEAHISTLAVHPDYREQGIGEQLLQAALEEAYTQGAALVTLEVRESNHAAINLYTKFGFRLVGRRSGYYRDNGEDALLMTLEDLRRWRATLDGGGG